jgi:two-component system sensor histidine kinase UhpB
MTLGARITSPEKRHIPLLWRLFVPNAAVLLAACVVLMVEPANGRVPALVGGLTVLLVLNVVIMRRAFSPLRRLTELMDAVDPLRPGQRIPPFGPESEVTVLTEAFNAMLDRVEDERRRSGRNALMAQEEERRRLAAELHDEIGQSLTALSLELDHVVATVPEVEATLGPARSITEATLDDVRRLARTLRPEALDQLGLGPALTSLCDRMSRFTRSPIERRLEPIHSPLGPDSELVIYRVAQESLTNVARHAPGAAVTVSLRELPGMIELEVRDDGNGLAPSPNGDGQGIRSMRERAVAVGGRFSIGPAPTGGTVVRLELPI